MHDAEPELTNVELGDDDDVEIIEVVGLDEDPGSSAWSERSEPVDAEEVVLSLDDDDDDLSAVASASAVGAHAARASEGEVSLPIGVTAELVERDRLVRLQADFDNFKKRTERERRRQEREANASLILRMLPILDNFERALNADAAGNHKGMRDGVILIFRQVLDEFRKEGLKAIESVGESFDPNVHEAVETDVSSEHPPHTVVSELQRGYTLAGRLLRPSLVKVAVDPDEQVEPVTTAEKT